jgi:seryl-tRNA synthetase
MDDEREREVIDKLQRLETTVQHKYMLLDKLSEENSLKELELANKRRNLRSRIGLLALVQDGAALDTTIREVEEHSSKLKCRNQELEKAISQVEKSLQSLQPLIEPTLAILDVSSTRLESERELLEDCLLVTRERRLMAEAEIESLEGALHQVLSESFMDSRTPWMKTSLDVVVKEKSSLEKQIASAVKHSNR